MITNTITKSREERFNEIKDSNFDVGIQQVRDSCGVRWVKCKVCGTIGECNDFVSYGGPGIEMNHGLCRSCCYKKIGRPQNI